MGNPLTSSLEKQTRNRASTARSLKEITSANVFHCHRIFFSPLSHSIIIVTFYLLLLERVKKLENLAECVELSGHFQSTLFPLLKNLLNLFEKVKDRPGAEERDRKVRSDWKGLERPSSQWVNAINGWDVRRKP